MIRLQIQLREEQVSALKRIARQEDASISELVRRGVDGLIRGDDTILWDRAMSVVGRFSGDAADVSERHDDYLDRALSE
jgi:hypothetical protein